MEVSILLGGNETVIPYMHCLRFSFGAMPMAEKSENKLLRFYSLAKKHRIPQAFVKSIPYIGSTIDELIFGDDPNPLIEKFHKESAERQSEILKKIDNLITNSSYRPAPIIVFGSGNTERTLYCSDDFIVGAKNLVTAKELIGGGGVNYATRLIAAGNDTFPVIAMGNDRVGALIQDQLIRTAKSSGVSEVTKNFISRDDLLVNGFQTTHATVLIHNNKRTIFSEKPGNYDILPTHFRNLMDYIDDLLETPPSAVIIGHLRTANESEGNLTKMIINHYKDKCPIFVNFGQSQLQKRLEYWLDVIPYIFSMQFNIGEVRQFFQTEFPKGRLTDIVDYIRENCITAVITIDRYGAVANYRDGKEGVIFAWPLIDDEEDVKDPTGAGDAFVSGMVSEVQGKNKLTFQEYYSAIEIGRLWAAYACTTLGGSAKSPDRSELNRFLNLRTSNYKAVEIMDRARAEHILRLINIANR